MNLMKSFGREYRTNNFFYSLAQEQLKIAYRITQYLVPEEESDINYNTLNHIISKDSIAIDYIFAECNFKCDSNYWYEETEKDAWELINYLLPKYTSNKENVKAQKRIQLLKELKELDEE